MQRFLRNFSRSGAATQRKNCGAGSLPLRGCAVARLCFVLVLALSCIAHAQDEKVVKIKSNLVNIDAIVKDKKGKYISDLMANDFVITENGQAQKIEFFDAPLAHSETHKAGEATTAGPSAPPTPPVMPRNYVSLVLDFQSTDIANLKRVR